MKQPINAETKNFSGPGAPKHIGMTEIIARIIYHTKGPRVLDVGCADHVPNVNSPHWLHGQLSEKFPDVTGIESDPKLVQALYDAGFGNVQIMNAETMSFPHKFDTIVAGELIEHLTDPAAFLRNARDLLQQEGRLVLSTPYAFGLIHLAYAYLRFPATCSNSQHVYLFCPSTLSNLITRCGFRVLHWELVDDYQFDNTTGKTLAFKYFIIFMRLFRHLLPRKIRSTSMIFVMEALQAESSSIP